MYNILIFQSVQYIKQLFVLYKVQRFKGVLRRNNVPY